MDPDLIAVNVWRSCSQRNCEKQLNSDPDSIANLMFMSSRDARRRKQLNPGVFNCFLPIFHTITAYRDKNRENCL